MALDTTVGGANADSWASAAEFTTFWQQRPQNTAVLALTSTEVDAALRWACLLMGASFNWTGAAVDATQALAWPRSGMKNRNGFAISTTENPKALKDAQCQLAGDLGVADRAADNDALKQGITSIKAGSVALTFADVKRVSSLSDMDAMLRRMGPEWDWLANAISDACRLLLVPSWYVRETLALPILLEFHR